MIETYKKKLGNYINSLGIDTFHPVPGRPTPESKSEVHSMKFPKPKNLTINEYPDLDTPQPELFKDLINNLIYLTEG